MIHPVYSTELTLKMTERFTREVESIEGDLVECGVAAGSQIAMMAKVSRKKIWGFDSFKGIPYAGANDDQQPGLSEVDKSKFGKLESTGISSHSKESVIENFVNWKIDYTNIELVEGWFQDTIPNNTIEKISLLRLDGDLYESTIIPLRHLWPKLVKGGILIMDDYVTLSGARKAFTDYFKGKKRPQEITTEDKGVKYFVK